MSIFSTIKYPITETFEVDHLALLPASLLENWWSDVIVWHYKRNKVVRVPPEPHRISTYLNNHTDKRSRDRHLQKLRQTIFNLDET